jgi:signal recognition particle subunit SRP54
MTPGERVTPKIINSSRKVRIANGSGVTVTEVNSLLERFVQAQKMMGQMAGSMGMPGMGPMSKKARGRQQQAVARKGKKGGKKAPARRQIGPGSGMPPGGIPGLPPGQAMPDLSKLDFSQFKDR